MSFLTGFGRGFLSFIAFFALSIWFTVAMLNATLLNRTMLTGWLQQSGVYDNIINALPTQLQAEGAEAEQSFITVDEFKQALSATFPPGYIQEQTEVVLNAAYDWVEGKAPTIAFSIPIQEKQAAFSANLATVLEPKLAALPPCTSRMTTGDQPTCLPPGMSAADYAAQLTQPQNAGGTPFLDKPLTEKELGIEMPPETSYVPSVVALVKLLVIILPIVVVVCGAAFVLLSESKLKGLGVVGRHMFIQAALVCAAGGALWYFGPTISLAPVIAEMEQAQKAIVESIAAPVIHTIVPQIGLVLLLIASVPTLVGASAWLTSSLLRKKFEKSEGFKTSHQHTPESMPLAETSAVKDASKTDEKEPKEETPTTPVAQPPSK